uniref:Uncharacterized protein n=2 Tax=Panagrolaimus superbus TaxID=310955 RepID=A0A914Z3X8_9BILA
MGNKPGQPLREDSRTQLQTAETLSVTPISSQHQSRKTGSSGSSTSNSRNSKQEAKKKNKLRKKRLPHPKLNQPSTLPPTAAVIQQTTQSVTGSDPNLLNQNQQVPEFLKKDQTIEEQVEGGGGGKLTEVKPTRKSKSSGKKDANRTTEETIEKDAKTDTVEKTTESPAPGTTSGGGLAKRKKYKISGPKPKDENTEFERIKTKARPARQKKNAQLAGSRNLAKMMDQTKTKEELSLKSFEEEEELVTARLEPTQQLSDATTQSADNKTSGDTADKSAEATDHTRHANKRSDYL